MSGVDPVRCVSLLDQQAALAFNFSPQRVYPRRSPFPCDLWGPVTLSGGLACNPALTSIKGEKEGNPYPLDSRYLPACSWRRCALDVSTVAHPLKTKKPGQSEGPR